MTEPVDAPYSALPQSQALCLSIIGVLLLGFVFGGRGFAHIGYSPIFISEVVLALCLMLYMMRPSVGVFLRSRIVLALLIFDVWGVVRTLPYVGEYGADALRDAVIYGYSLFALIIGALMARQEIIVTFLRLFDRVSTVAVILLPLFLILSELENSYLEQTVPLFTIKTGDTSVLLAGVMAFRLLGLPRLVTGRRPPLTQELLFWICAFGSMIWSISANRGGMLAIISAVLIISLLRYGRRHVILFCVMTLTLLLFLAAFDARIERGPRELSASQIVANVASIAADDVILEQGQRVNYSDMQSTIRWRLQWWGKIIDYVVFGDYFWTGRGFGVNLADTDGFQTSVLAPLRSPHNAHMTILARAGVPGLVIWLVLQGAFVVALVRLTRKMRRHKATGWDRLYVWILAFWAASVVNGSFDVYLEGPQGGIWFWSIFGFGIAAADVGRLAVFDTAEIRPVS